MLTYEARRRINRPPDAVFDLIGTNVYDNHPSWESEVVEIRPLTEPPVQLGSRAIMVRREYGRRSEVVRAQPKGAFRLLTPLIGRSLPKTSERITSQMVAFVEQHSSEEPAQ